MKKFESIALFGFVAAFAFVSPAARADQADDAFNAWNAAFLVRNNGRTYYSTTVTTAGTSRSGTWVGALDIAVAEDTYQRTHSAAHRQLVNDLLTTFIAAEGADWSGDTWDDDIAWMVIAVLRGYQITGNRQFLTIAENNWNMAYSRGWDTKYGGGGVWEDLGHVTPTFNQPSKCCLSNNPLIKMGLVLYRMTADTTYLTKSQGMYSWIRKNLFDAGTGLVNECLAFKNASDTAGFVQTSDNAYNSGSFLEAADDLYRITGDQAYYSDALLAVTHRVTKDGVLHDNGEGERQWAYRFVKGLNEFATYNGLWSKYQSWLESNANAAWSQRNSLNVTWNDWTMPTPLPGANGVSHGNDVVPLCTSSAAAIWQLLAPSTVPPFSGAYELQSAANGLSLSVVGSAAGNAVIQNAFKGGDESLWTFVASSGGYYKIQNVSSGLLVDVKDDSYALGASLVQAAPEGHGQGNDQWMPVANSDGTYSFYSLSSAMALDDSSSSTAGTPLDQSAGDGSAGQSFKLISHVPSGGGPDADGGSKVGAGPAASGSAGLDEGGAGAVASADAGGTGAEADGSGASRGGGSADESSPSGSGKSSGCACTTLGGASRTQSPGALWPLIVAFVAGTRSRRRRRAVRSNIGAASPPPHVAQEARCCAGSKAGPRNG